MTPLALTTTPLYRRLKHTPRLDGKKTHLVKREETSSSSKQTTTSSGGSKIINGSGKRPQFMKAIKGVSIEREFNHYFAQKNHNL
jgi:hypothetical protein